MNMGHEEAPDGPMRGTEGEVYYSAADTPPGLAAVQQATPDLFSVEQLGVSVEGRSINHVWFGRGPMHVLLWSQMHGDEPTATAALFDLFEYVRRHRTEAHITRMPHG